MIQFISIHYLGLRSSGTAPNIITGLAIFWNILENQTVLLWRDLLILLSTKEINNIPVLTCDKSARGKNIGHRSELRMLTKIGFIFSFFPISKFRSQVWYIQIYLVILGICPRSSCGNTLIVSSLCAPTIRVFPHRRGFGALIVEINSWKLAIISIIWYFIYLRFFRLIPPDPPPPRP